MPIITNLRAGSWAGSFAFEQEGKAVSGNFSADGNKNLQSISGSVADAGNFNGWNNGEGGFSYNFDGISDISKLIALGQAAAYAVTTIREELEAPNNNEAS